MYFKFHFMRADAFEMFHGGPFKGQIKAVRGLDFTASFESNTKDFESF